MNSVILIGRLTRDPEMGYTSNTQTAKCVFTLAIDRPVKQGEEKQADFPRVVVWGRQAETAGRYLHKGSQCAVRGSVRTGSYKNREGQTVYTTDIYADRVEFLGGANNSSGAVNGVQNANNGSYQPNYAQARQPQAQPQEFAPVQPQRFAPAQPQGVQQTISYELNDLPDNFSAAEDDIPF